MTPSFNHRKGVNMNGSEFQEIYQYLSALEKRIEVIETKVESLLESSELEPEAIPSDKKEY
ncbi:MAG TPA: hypothetical protein VFI60_05550 [Candidatus Acidoferrum sp.]|nr:hypothetical protein [Candidatus Acidoferrum sp.]